MENAYQEKDAILDMVNAQIWQLVDPQTYGAVNLAHASFLGISKSDFECRKITETLPAETAEALSDGNLKIFSSAMSSCTTKIIKNYQGKERHIAITKTPRLDENNNVKYVVCTGIDITEFEDLEEDLHHANASLRTFLSASPIGIAIVENRKISWVNDELLKIFGCESSDEIVGKSTKEFYAQNADYDMLGNEIYRRLRQGKPVVKDLVLKRSDGSEFIGHLKISSYDAGNPTQKAILTLSDITWRKEAEEHRIQSEKLKGVIEMAGAVCHELNQPLQAVLGFSELLMMDLSNANPLYERLNSIVNQIRRMGELTGKLHKITKYETKDYLEGKIIDIDRSTD